MVESGYPGGKRMAMLVRKHSSAKRQNDKRYIVLKKGMSSVYWLCVILYVQHAALQGPSINKMDRCTFISLAACSLCCPFVVYVDVAEKTWSIRYSYLTLSKQ